MMLLLESFKLTNRLLWIFITCNSLLNELTQKKYSQTEIYIHPLPTLSYHMRIGNNAVPLQVPKIIFRNDFLESIFNTTLSVLRIALPPRHKPINRRMDLGSRIGILTTLCPNHPPTETPPPSKSDIIPNLNFFTFLQNCFKPLRTYLYDSMILHHFQSVSRDFRLSDFPKLGSKKC